MKRYDYIDALRGIAILLVLIAHVSDLGRHIHPDWLYNLAAVDVGPRGVQLFYIVSAFTLCLSFNKRRTSERHPVRNFYIRRFFRIAPLFYIAIIYYLWQQHYWAGNPQHFSFLNILTTFTFTNGISPYWINNIVIVGWSIAIESTFYLIFPLLFRQLKSIRYVVSMTLGITILMQIMRLYFLSFPLAQTNFTVQTYTFQFFPSQFPIFLIGMALFLLLTTHTFTSSDKRFLKLFSVGFIFLLLVQFLFHLKIIAGHYLYGLGFAMLLAFLYRYAVRVLVNPITTYIGKISFSMYLCHNAIYYWLDQCKLVNLFPSHDILNWLVRFIVLLCCSSIVSSILFYSIETWGQKIGSKIVDHLERIPPDNSEKELKTW